MGPCYGPKLEVVYNCVAIGLSVLPPKGLANLTANGMWWQVLAYARTHTGTKATQ